MATKHQVLIVGGGAGGIATAASLLKRRPLLDIAIIEPREEHYYQPGWTMVGGGVFDQAQTVRSMASVMPHGVTWIKGAVSGFNPDKNEVKLKGGGKVGYDWLVVSPGNRLDWDAVDGLAKTLGKNGVTSNYMPGMAPYTWELVQGLKSGRALFTQPPMPFKCAGAPQKAMYLSSYEWERQGVLNDIDVQFHTAAPALFGVAAYVPALMETIERYGIGLNLESNLVAVDGAARKATFATKKGEKTIDFDMLHVSPPQKGNPVVADSALADAAGYVEVDPATLQHVRYPNVFGLGDAGNTPNAKTAAAVRKQAPTVAVNLIEVMEGHSTQAVYDGYGSCPLTVERGKIVLAEFGYGGKLLPTFPSWINDGTRPSRFAWYLKERVLPTVYWDAMLHGKEWLASPRLKTQIHDDQH